jgi:hypothetical protein
MIISALDFKAYALNFYSFKVAVSNMVCLTNIIIDFYQTIFSLNKSFYMCLYKPMRN